MPSIFKLLKDEFISLFKFPTTKDSNEIRFRKRIVRFPAPINERRRSSKTTVAAKTQTIQVPTKVQTKKAATEVRPRSNSAPSNVKIEQQHISRNNQSIPQSKLSQRVSNRKKTTSVNISTRSDRSSTVVQIEV